jgi:hypothetical protein
LNLIPGVYRVDVETPGFKHLTRDRIEVRVSNATRADIALSVGEVSQTAEVNSAPNASAVAREIPGNAEK